MEASGDVCALPRSRPSAPTHWVLTHLVNNLCTTVKLCFILCTCKHLHLHKEYASVEYATQPVYVIVR